MAGVSVDPEYLKELAGYQQKAEEKSVAGAKATDSTPTQLWVTHGVMSGHSNNAGGGCIAARRAAGGAIAKAAADLAAKLRTTAETYTAVDDDLSKNLNTQMLSK